MGIFNEFYKKEKPFFTGITRGLGGFGFGAVSAAEPGEAGALSGASGGTLVSPNPGGYELRHFPTNANFAYTSAGANAEIYVVAVGGGGGGGFSGGGGGGVAYAYKLPVPSSPASYPIAIGGGGENGANGGNTAFQGHPVGTITANGGGGMGSPVPNSNTRNGDPGGSGGGAGHSNPNNPTAGTATQPTSNPGVTWPEGQLYQYGNPGGAGNGPAPNCCEGGGGGGAYGPAPKTSALPPDFKESGTFRPNASKNVSGDGNGGGDGGNGITFGFIPSSLGDSGYFAGGGGGAYAPPGGGGQGGGGNGSGDPGNNPSATPATDGTGGGAGGGNSVQASGGDGICLVYYPAA